MLQYMALPVAPTPVLNSTEMVAFHKRLERKLKERVYVGSNMELSTLMRNKIKTVLGKASAKQG